MTRGGAARNRDLPERRCIATGESGPTDRLVRFVLGPEAVVVPDLAAKLPGRGVWLTAERALVERAVAKKLFSRAFKAQAAAPGDLADRLEALLAQRLIDVIGLARKAGQAVTGFEKVRARLKDAASCSFDCFNIDLKERPDDTVSSIDLQRTVHLCGPRAEQEQLAFGDPGSGAG